MKRVCSISIDVDSLGCYYQIHGITEREETNIIYEKAIPRFLDMLDKFGFKATFFVVGKDVHEGNNQEIIKDIIHAGHNIGNHTWSHPYNLIRLSLDAIREEIEEAHLLLQRITGTTISGFRSPGYNINTDIMMILKELNYRYDSSIFPSVPYYLTKFAAILLKKIRGRRSHSVMGHPGMLFAPSNPYFASSTSPWRTEKERDGLVELPISTLPVIGFPFIGTYVALAGSSITRLTYEMIKRLRGFLNLEFHAIDLLSLKEDRIDPALSCQVDLKVSYQEKLKYFKELFSSIREDYEVLTLEQVAERMSD